MTQYTQIYVTSLFDNVGWLVGCGLTSHSAIFHLYSDGTVVQFPNLDPCRAPNAKGNWGSLACRAYPDTGTGTSEDAFNLLAIREPTRGEGKPKIEPGSSDPQSSPLPLRHRDGLFHDVMQQWHGEKKWRK